MKIAVLKEQVEGERRVAATPETVKKFIGLGAKMAVEQGAGTSASFSDAEYEAAGAQVAPRSEALAGADTILAVQGPDPDTIGGAAAGALLVGILNPFGRRDRVDSYAAAGVRRE